MARFPRVLGKYVRDEKVLTLPDAIRAHDRPAPPTQFGIRDRGLIRVGHMADLVVFNPATISDTATYEKPHQYPTGIEHVIVNGVPVLDPKGLTGARPGPSALRPGANAMTFASLLPSLALAARASADRRRAWRWSTRCSPQGGDGRVTGSVKLTLANSAPSAATAYERRSVGPRRSRSRNCETS